MGGGAQRGAWESSSTSDSCPTRIHKSCAPNFARLKLGFRVGLGVSRFRGFFHLLPSKDEVQGLGFRGLGFRVHKER